MSNADKDKDKRKGAVKQKKPKLRAEDFDLIALAGKGGFGKVSPPSLSLLRALLHPFSVPDAPDGD